MVAKLFVSLSIEQARFVFEYVLHLGKGKPENAESMKTAMNQVYGETKTQEVYSLMDYFRDEARSEGKREIAMQMVRMGLDTSTIANATGLYHEEVKKLKK